MVEAAVHGEGGRPPARRGGAEPLADAGVAVDAVAVAIELLVAVVLVDGVAAAELGGADAAGDYDADAPAGLG